MVRRAAPDLLCAAFGRAHPVEEERGAGLPVRGVLGPLQRALRHLQTAFASFLRQACEVSALQVAERSSGKQQRRRLNRGGDRQANAALYRIVHSRVRWEPRTQTYLTRRISEGKTRSEVIRFLKRYVAREIFSLLPRTDLTPTRPSRLDTHRGVQTVVIEDLTVRNPLKNGALTAPSPMRPGRTCASRWNTSAPGTGANSSWSTAYSQLEAMRKLRHGPREAAVERP